MYVLVLSDNKQIFKTFCCRRGDALLSVSSCFVSLSQKRLKSSLMKPISWRIINSIMAFVFFFDVRCKSTMPLSVVQKESTFCTLFYSLPPLRACALRVLTDKCFLPFMFQNVFVMHWLSIVSMRETLRMKFHFWFHPFIFHLLHQGLFSLAPRF